MAEHGKPGQGIGARVLRKEDSRHLHGRGQYVSDMVLPGQREVAFLRSPIAHGRIRGIRKPAGSEGTVFVREDMAEALAFAAAGKVKADIELQPLTAINDVFDRLEHGKVEARVVLDFASV